MKTEISVNQSTPVTVQSSSDAHVKTDYSTNQHLPGTAVQHAEKSSATDASHEKPSKQIRDNEQSTAAEVTRSLTENESKNAEDSATDADSIKAAMEKVKDNMDSIQRSFDFKVDDESGKMVVTILNRSTKEVLRQIPSEEFLVMARNLETTKGNLFKGEA